MLNLPWKTTFNFMILKEIKSSLLMTLNRKMENLNKSITKLKNTIKTIMNKRLLFMSNFTTFSNSKFVVRLSYQSSFFRI